MAEKIVTKYARMWPREVWDILENNALVLRKMPELKESGVYILYRDEVPILHREDEEGACQAAS